MTLPNGPTLREYIERLFKDHDSAHNDHERFHAREHDFAQKAIDKASELASQNKADANEWRAAMNDRERTFPTKAELSAVSEKVVALEQAEIRRVENERLRLIGEAEEKRNLERAQTRQQWLIGLAVGTGAVLVNLIIRLLGA